jgi:DNA (cytosine-5)-methyltransferase 1
MEGRFSFADLFAGIGGFHLGCVKNGGECVLACEKDETARKIYESNYGIIPYPDINKLKPQKNIDLVCAGFPCQSHSTLGERLGLKDVRGKLFHKLKHFLHKSQPRAFLLENVKGLLTSNNGESFQYILSSLHDIGYTITWCILDSKNFGLPQHRERVYIVGHKQKQFDFSYLLQAKKQAVIKDIMDKHPVGDLSCSIFDDAEIFKPPIKTDTGFVLRAKLSNYTNRKLFSSNGIIGTIPTASPPPIYDERVKIARHLSKNELKKCQGFPVSFKFPENLSRSDVVHYIGNAVSVNVIVAIVQELKRQEFI